MCESPDHSHAEHAAQATGLGPQASDLGPRASGQGLGVFVALKLLRGYKILISPYFRGSCRFLPSCADYASEAITRFGLVRGVSLAAWRLVRCQPLCAAGHDPVPDKVSGFPRLGTFSRSHHPVPAVSGFPRSLPGADSRPR